MTEDSDLAATADRTVAGEGTPIADWQAWPPWRQAPLIDVDVLVPEGCRLVVISPHPDDEILGSGALLHDAHRAGREVLVLAVTDGEGSHPGSRQWAPGELGSTRAYESEKALAVLGIPADQLVRLGLPDGGLVRRQAEVSRALVSHIDRRDVVVTPWRYDGHPDHEIVAHAVLDVLDITAAAHLEVPIWGLHWARPEQRVLPWHRAHRLPLDAETQKLKAAAVDCFGSQLAPDETTGRDAVLPTWALDRLVTDCEVYFR
ncbi:MAG: acetylglucosaminylphosphatidylinositol deacetylase [Frankiales bacterium]|nr:acetylglucosaminylphosphatidylinositol deacetylase [Frankiales bacterium]